MSDTESNRSGKSPLQDRVTKLIKPLIPADAEDRVYRAFRQWNNRIREHIRNETALKLSDGEGQNAVSVKVVDGFTDPLARLIDKYNDPVLWRLTVANITTLVAAHALVADGSRPLALNFANGVEPGGGFLRGATAQEETLCRSSALYATLFGDPMYDFHRDNDPARSSDWAILSPDVPVFRNDAGMECDKPWPLSILTCAAPYAPAIGRTESAKLLRGRIYRVLAIARAYHYQSLVLGAWGCGVFANDPLQTATDFRSALEGDFAGAFSRVIFAITDWSDNRRYLRPFCDVFQPNEKESKT